MDLINFLLILYIVVSLQNFPLASDKLLLLYK